MYEEETHVYTTSTTGQRYVHPSTPLYDGGNIECNPWLDTSYLRTLPGLLKIIVIFFNFLCFMCVLIGGPAYYAGVGGATFVSVFGFIISTTLLMLYLFHLVDQWPQIPWIVCEMIYCFSWTIFYFIAGSVLAVASVSHYHAAGWAIAAARFFGFSAMLAYALDCYLKFLAWKNNERAMGGMGAGGGRGGLPNGRGGMEHY
ncbi:MARVEL domain-containing protein [Meloidogyne graminicola]|uniref:MARVEL domain-containing protein n=1 Tax=Meloidogyne graminicola TaxID=189291 RepID=A0A8S9ZK13_9BILA|nr:MARVEL domain-containing protein [Meloidogyne graminicola]